MKKAALVIALCVLIAAVAGAAGPMDDEDFRTGLKHYNRKNYNAAVKHFREYADRHPDPTAYYFIGYSLYELGRFSEADAYFTEAFFVDPEFSLEKTGLLNKEILGRTAKAPAAGKQIKAESEAKPVRPPAERPETAVTEVASPELVKPGPAEQTAKKPEPPSAPATTQGASEQKQRGAPAELPVSPVPKAPSMPEFKRQMPSQGEGALAGIFAALGVFMIIIWLAFYVYFCLCLFLIAKKLHVEAPWTAWIPLVQIWTIVASAGKPWWWVLLLFIPLVNLFVAIYLWMCIAENLGRDKWLGLLMIVPLVNMIFLGMLAFSRSERPQGLGSGVTLSE